MAYRYEKNPVNGQPDLVIDGWENGISNSPHTGIADMRNVLNDVVPGVVMCNYKLALNSQSAQSFTFTTDFASHADFFVLSGTQNTNFKVGSAIKVSNSGGSLPTGLTAGTIYYVRSVSGVGLFIATDPTIGTSINMTSNGTGTQTVITVTPGTMNDYAQTGIGIGSSQITYMVDDAGNIWSNELSILGTVTVGFSLIHNVGNVNLLGIAIFNNYLLVCGGGTIYTWGLLSASFGSRVWRSSLTVSTGAGQMHYFNSTQTVYFCNGAYVAATPNWQIGSLNQVNGKVFDPTDATTYNLNRAALLLPPTEIASWIDEQGAELMIGTSTSNYLYPWDTISLFFDTPIILPETNTYKLLNINRVLYIFCGQRGNIYYTLGTTAQILLSLPRQNNTPVTSSFTWGGVMSLGNHLMFATYDGNYNNTGIFQTNLNVGSAVNPITGSIVFHNQSSLLPQNNSTVVQNTVLAPTYDGITYFCAWTSLSGGGIDKLDLSDFYPNYESYVVSDIIPVGTSLQPKTFSRIEMKLDTPLIAGDTIRISMRSDLSQSWTQCFETTTVGVIDDNSAIPVEMQKWVQIKAELHANSPAGGNPSFVRLKQIRLTK